MLRGYFLLVYGQKLLIGDKPFEIFNGVLLVFVNIRLQIGFLAVPDIDHRRLRGVRGDKRGVTGDPLTLFYRRGRIYVEYGLHLAGQKIISDVPNFYLSVILTTTDDNILICWMPIETVNVVQVSLKCVEW